MSIHAQTQRPAVARRLRTSDRRLRWGLLVPLCVATAISAACSSSDSGNGAVDDASNAVADDASQATDANDSGVKKRDAAGDVASEAAPSTDPGDTGAPDAVDAEALSPKCSACLATNCANADVEGPPVPPPPSDPDAGVEAGAGADAGAVPVHPLFPPCTGITGTASEGPGKDAPFVTLCQEAYRCMTSSRCAYAKGSLSDCYCGTASGAGCLTPGSANGTCKAEMEAALETTDPSKVATNLLDPNAPAARAIFLVQCTIDYCADDCNAKPAP